MHVSPRQSEILSLIADGYSDKQIARRLGMSARTIDSHLQRLYQRYDVHSRAAIVAKWLLGGGFPVIQDGGGLSVIQDGRASTARQYHDQ